MGGQTCRDHVGGGGSCGWRALAICLALGTAPFDIDLVQTPEVLIGSNFQEFDTTGKLINERYIATLTTLMEFSLRGGSGEELMQ